MVHSLEYPTQLYDMVSDPDELRNLADHPDWVQATKLMLSRVNSMWDLEQLKQDVIDNQSVRQLLARSLGKGAKYPWEHYPNPHATSTQWVRTGDYFPEVEQRGYIPYPKK